MDKIWFGTPANIIKFFYQEVNPLQYIKACFDQLISKHVLFIRSFSTLFFDVFLIAANDSVFEKNHNLNH